MTCVLQPSRCLFVARLHETITEDDMIAFAKCYGEVDSVKIIRDHETQQCKGYGFINMQSVEDALKVGRLYRQQFSAISQC